MNVKPQYRTAAVQALNALGQPTQQTRRQYEARPAEPDPEEAERDLKQWIEDSRREMEERRAKEAAFRKEWHDNAMPAAAIPFMLERRQDPSGKFRRLSDEELERQAEKADGVDRIMDLNRERSARQEIAKMVDWDDGALAQLVEDGGQSPEGIAAYRILTSRQSADPKGK